MPLRLGRTLRARALCPSGGRAIHRQVYTLRPRFAGRAPRSLVPAEIEILARIVKEILGKQYVCVRVLICGCEAGDRSLMRA